MALPGTSARRGVNSLMVQINYQSLFFPLTEYPPGASACGDRDDSSYYIFMGKCALYG
jgi:hypothetical protein